MGWPYEFLTLDQAEKHARRQSLDRYAAYAQLSAVVPVIVFLLYRLGAWLVRTAIPQRGAYSAVPSVPDSPVLKQQRQSAVGSWARAARRAAWWLGDDIRFLGQNWGQRDQMIVGIGWTMWLILLCVLGTGKDYLHLTKRFGIIATSQFPLQYLLSLKSLNPIAFAFRSSHEQVNRWHRVLGRIVYFLLILHACFYLNFYIQEGILSERLVRLVPVLGLVAFFGMVLLNSTAISFIRQYSYRVFFITHLVVALALPPIIFIHARHAGLYMAEALLVFFVDIVKRKIDTIVASTTLELIPGTDLIKIVASIPSQKISRFREHPAAHIYLSIPAAARPTSSPLSAAYLVFEFAFNPFTVAAVDEESKELILVARRHKGPMTRTLGHFANGGVTSMDIPLSIDGPYGCTKRFPNLAGSRFDRILLVAGGVGATFILPLYRAILSENSAARVQMVWAVRGAGDATWPVSETAKSILDDDNVHLFLTGDIFEATGEAAGSSDGSEAIELSQVHQHQRSKKHVSTQSRRRPDLQKIVDDLFRQGMEDRVAVLVCGPEEMARELRAAVGVWVHKGRDIWWHNESFAW
ncbi:ferric reductase like transmembrane component [Whalleya microplaca]|nr:ferric reductase like transmembrane component [Whalleya microplaca]